MCAQFKGHQKCLACYPAVPTVDGLVTIRIRYDIIQDNFSGWEIATRYLIESGFTQRVLQDHKINHQQERSSRFYSSHDRLRH